MADKVVLKMSASVKTLPISEKNSYRNCLLHTAGKKEFKDSMYVEGFIVKDGIIIDHSWIENNNEVWEITLSDVNDIDYYPFSKNKLEEIAKLSFETNSPSPMYKYNLIEMDNREKVLHNLIEAGGIEQ